MPPPLGLLVRAIVCHDDVSAALHSQYPWNFNTMMKDMNPTEWAALAADLLTFVGGMIPAADAIMAGRA